jgi:alpha-tubulin suppressor-like RCC1 family protein
MIFKLYGMGSNAFGMLSLEDRNSRSTPTLISQGVSRAWAGYAFTMMQDRCSEHIFSAGYARNGRCAVPDSEIPWKSEDGFPMLLKFTKSRALSNLKDLKNIALGAGHGAAVTHDGRVWTWGRNDCGQTGLIERVAEVNEMQLETGVNGSETSYLPREVNCGGEKVREAFCGSYHTIVLTEENHVYGFGLNSNSQANISSEERIVKTPKQWEGLEDDIAAILAGPFSTACTLKNDFVLLLNSRKLSFDGGINLLALPFGWGTRGTSRMYYTDEEVFGDLDYLVDITTSSSHFLVLYLQN